MFNPKYKRNPSHIIILKNYINKKINCSPLFPLFTLLFATTDAPNYFSFASRDKGLRPLCKPDAIDSRHEAADKRLVRLFSSRVSVIAFVRWSSCIIIDGI